MISNLTYPGSLFGLVLKLASHMKIWIWYITCVIRCCRTRATSYP